MNKVSIRRHIVVPLVAVFALAALPAAAQIQVKACFETIHKRCCELATGVDLTITCSEGDYSWICVGSITKDKLVTTTQAATSGLKYSASLGTETCAYKKPACGRFKGGCDFGEEVSTTCDVKAGAGPDCISPVLAAADGEEGAAALSSCSDK